MHNTKTTYYHFIKLHTKVRKNYVSHGGIFHGHTKRSFVYLPFTPPNMYIKDVLKKLCQFAHIHASFGTSIS